MTQLEVKEIFSYDWRGFLRYRKRPTQSKNRRCTKAGTLAAKRYYVRIKGKSYMLHRLIFLYHRGFMPAQVDHINGNPLDNRIQNLRAATHGQNIMNRGATRRNKSGYKGVHMARGAYRVELMADGTRYRIGPFKTAEAAAKAYDHLARRLHGDFAKTNFKPRTRK